MSHHGCSGIRYEVETMIRIQEKDGENLESRTIQPSFSNKAENSMQKRSAYLNP